ncbi:MAG TPA: 50S ribosomal protein L4 [Gammaproteobacteria bacterium]|nr:50S ribosomal protein L4 [Gammaproteobacteria bacterium]
MDLNVYDSAGGEAGQVTVPEAVFAAPFKDALVHQVVVAYLAAGRAGTRAQKTRSQVRGGGSKPWRQKGTGRARAGTIRSPLWRGGGKSFAAVPQDHAQKVNKKMYRGAMRAIVAELVRQERLLVVDALTVAEPKTRALVAVLEELGVASDKVLLVDVEPSEALYLSARNLPAVEVLAAAEIDPVSLVGFDKTVVSKSAVEQIGEALS